MRVHESAWTPNSNALHYMIFMITPLHLDNADHTFSRPVISPSHEQRHGDTGKNQHKIADCISHRISHSGYGALYIVLYRT